MATMYYGDRPFGVPDRMVPQIKALIDSAVMTGNPTWMPMIESFPQLDKGRVTLAELLITTGVPIRFEFRMKSDTEAEDRLAELLAEARSRIAEAGGPDLHLV